MSKNSKQLQITLVKSLSGRLKKHKETMRALGLSKIRQSRVIEDIPQMRGMVNQVSYLLKVEEV